MFSSVAIAVVFSLSTSATPTMPIPSLPASTGVSSFAPCAAPPPGTRCVAGGPIQVGNNEGKPNERPERSLEISTFYVDTSLVTRAQYRSCVNAGVCPPLSGTVAAPVDDGVALAGYESALKFCSWSGKRLLSEWEWEKAARLGMFTADASLEWTATWAGERLAQPCEQCDGRDPAGPCGGTDPCARGGKQKIVRGGLAGETAKHVSARAALPASMARGAIRCASSSFHLWGFPSASVTAGRTAAADPGPPSETLRATAHAVEQDTLNKATCEKKGRSFLDCRDPSSYVKTNEPRQFLWRKYIENLGGGYVGVGIDQNYSLMAIQQAEWGWLFDYDPTVVRLHLVLRALIKQSESRSDFLSRFEERYRGEAVRLIEIEYANIDELPAIRETYLVLRKTLLPYYRKQARGEREDPLYGWLATDAAYAYVRRMYVQDRIVVLKGDMLAAKTMQGIGRAARAMNTAVRVYYTSNAPEFWPLTAQYKSNVNALPLDDESVVLQTFSGLSPGFRQPRRGYWHYNVQSGQMHQDLLRRDGVILSKQLVTVRNKTDDPDLTISGLRGAAADSSP